MTRSLFLLPFAALLVSCDQDPNRGADGYHFESPQVILTNPQITVVTHPSIKALRRSIPIGIQLEVNKNPEFQAYAIVRPSANTCEIHIIDPIVSYTPELFGHELVHCLYGDWHPTQPQN